MMKYSSLIIRHLYDLIFLPKAQRKMPRKEQKDIRPRERGRLLFSKSKHILLEGGAKLFKTLEGNGIYMALEINKTQKFQEVPEITRFTGTLHKIIYKQ